MSKQKRPKIIRRIKWRARPPKGRRTPHAPKSVVVHHTVYPTLLQSAPKSAETARMRDIQKQHQSQGWLDIAYHIIIMPSGRIYRGRPMATIGSHVENNNTGRIGIAFDGNFDTGKPTAKALDSFRSLMKHHPKLKNMKYDFHTDYGGTACPGLYLIAALS